jgi:hypothetical protein
MFRPYPVLVRQIFVLISAHTHTQLIQHRENIQISGAYNNNDNNITTASVGTALNNARNIDAAGGREREKTNDEQCAETNIVYERMTRNGTT